MLPEARGSTHVGVIQEGAVAGAAPTRGPRAGHEHDVHSGGNYGVVGEEMPKAEIAVTERFFAKENMASEDCPQPALVLEQDKFLIGIAALLDAHYPNHKALEFRTVSLNGGEYKNGDEELAAQGAGQVQQRQKLLRMACLGLAGGAGSGRYSSIGSAGSGEVHACLSQDFDGYRQFIGIDTLETLSFCAGNLTHDPLEGLLSAWRES